MEISGVWGGIYRVMDWVMKLVYLQCLWMVFSIAGLLVFGLFPSTMAMYAVTRKWIMAGADIPVFSTFWQAYKKEFVRTNILGWIHVGLGFIFFFYLRLFKGLDQVGFDVLFFFTLILSVVYIMNLLFLAPVFVHYQLKIREVIKYSSFIAIYNPFHTIAMAVIIGGVSYVLLLFSPGIILFFGISLVTWICTWIAHLAFIRIEQKHLTSMKRNLERSKESSIEAIY
jgi:uncharacterized membrane protein YesL